MKWLLNLIATNYIALLSAGSSAARSYPVSLVLSGYYNWEEGTILTQDVYGYFWATSSSTSSATSRFLYVGGDYLNPQNGAHKELGFTLRCKNSDLFPAGSSAARSYPVSLVLSGSYYWYPGYGTLWGQNTIGYFWESQVDSSELTYYLATDDIQLTQYAGNKRYGFALRCVKLVCSQ